MKTIKVSENGLELIMVEESSDWAGGLKRITKMTSTKQDLFVEVETIFSYRDGSPDDGGYYSYTEGFPEGSTSPKHAIALMAKTLRDE